MMARASWPSASHRSRPMGLFAALTARRAHSSRVLLDHLGRRSQTDRSAAADRAENAGTTSGALMGCRHCGPILTERPVLRGVRLESVLQAKLPCSAGRLPPSYVRVALSTPRGGHLPQIVVPGS